MKLLIIEDDIYTQVLMKKQLEKKHYVDIASTGKEALELVKMIAYDAVIIDYVLPDINGQKVCEYIRKEKIDTPLIFVTGQTIQEKKIHALYAGADDYITKPFDIEELFARIHTLVRRSTQKEVLNTISIGKITLDTRAREVYHKGKNIRLRRKEFDILELLMKNVNKVVRRENMIDYAWDTDADFSTNTLDVHIMRLRNVFDKPYGTHMIQTVSGFGYKLVTP